MAHNHTTVSISQSKCVAAGGVNKLCVPTVYDQSRPMGSARLIMMGMKNTGGRLKRWDEHGRKEEKRSDGARAERKTRSITCCLTSSRRLPHRLSQQMPLHNNYKNLTVSRRHPLNILLERACWCSDSNRNLPEWMGNFSCADIPLLEIAHSSSMREPFW